ncbi:MAG: cobalt ECF transporter T component CbiQ [Thermodesulfobacteriota bacterium]
MKDKIPTFLKETPPFSPPNFSGPIMRVSFIEKGINHLAAIIDSAYAQWELASREGLLQKVDARLKVFFLLFFIFIISIKHKLEVMLGLGIFLFLLVTLSKLNLIAFYKRVFLLSFFFGFLVTLPATFNLVNKGEVILPLFSLSRPYSFWLYEIPQEVGMTKEGLQSMVLLVLRLVNSLSLCFLIIHTTPFPEIIKSLSIMKIPPPVLMIITLAYKYVLLFAHTAQAMHLAHKSRFISKSGNESAQKWVAGRLFTIFKKTRRKGEETFRAMLSRGFNNEIRFFSFKKFTWPDCLIGSIFLGIGLIFLMA